MKGKERIDFIKYKLSQSELNLNDIEWLLKTSLKYHEALRVVAYIEHSPNYYTNLARVMLEGED